MRNHNPEAPAFWERSPSANEHAPDPLLGRAAVEAEDKSAGRAAGREGGRIERAMFRLGWLPCSCGVGVFVAKLEKWRQLHNPLAVIAEVAIDATNTCMCSCFRRDLRLMEFTLKLATKREPSQARSTLALVEPVDALRSRKADASGLWLSSGATSKVVCRNTLQHANRSERYC